MRVAALLLLAGLASACASTAPEVEQTPEHLLAPQYRALPSVPVGEPIAVAAPAAPTGDDALDAFLAELAAAIDRHDWRGVAARFEPEGYAEQWALVDAERQNAVASAVQVLAETLGMHEVLRPYDSLGDDSLGDDSLEADPVSRLDRLRVVTIRDVRRDADGSVQVRGDVRLDDDSRLPLDFSLQPMGDAFAVIVPMG